MPAKKARGRGRAKAELGFRAKIQLTFGRRTLFGDGKARLLTLVDQLGSLRQAAQEMKMSYRYAWGLVRELEDAAGFTFLEHAGGGPRGRLRLSGKGREFLEAYRAFREPLDDLVRARFDTVFAESKRAANPGLR